jgi:enterochelin esterase-like enzyme
MLSLTRGAFALLIFLCLTQQLALAQRRPQPPAVVSPEVHPDGRVTFRLLGPEAHEVTLNASWVKGPKNMAKDEKGIWSLTIVEPDIYNYTYSIDGVRTIDPHNPWVKTGVRAASSTVEVPASSPLFYDLRKVPHGEVHIHYYESKALGVTRRLHVYTPPGYDPAKNQRYPVLYLLHGAGDDDSTWTSIGRANLILDNLLADRKAEPMIVVMPFGHTPARAGSSVERQVTSQAFENDLLGDVIPLIESKYRVRKDAASRAIAGLSMGGGQSSRIGLGHPELFQWVGAFSAAVRDVETNKPIQKFLSDPKKANQLKLLWIGCGKDDFLLDANKKLVALLEEKGIHHTFRLSEGDHSWPVWRRYLNEMAPLLFAKRR